MRCEDVKKKKSRFTNVSDETFVLKYVTSRPRIMQNFTYGRRNFKSQIRGDFSGQTSPKILMIYLNCGNRFTETFPWTSFP